MILCGFYLFPRRDNYRPGTRAHGPRSLLRDDYLRLPRNRQTHAAINSRNLDPLALASSSYRDAVDGVVQGLDIGHYFQAVVSGLDVARVKPAPDIFLAAARQAGATPSQCLVLEDAEKGVLAAREAGMSCIAVPTEQTRHHDFSQATRVCSSLNEITLELIDSLSH
ncbi:MAG: HAD-IA family hydrolase [Deltaproteobacteria bacterium]|nr:HAD-IA family hydrolase [Deltaproteobacteria bacterium]